MPKKPSDSDIAWFMDRYNVNHKTAKTMSRYGIDTEVRIKMEHQTDALRWLHREQNIPFSQIIMYNGGRFIVADDGIATMMKMLWG